MTVAADTVVPVPAGAVVLESREARIVVLPSYGGRVVSLIDRRTGRDWMAPGGVSGSVGEDAVYSAGEAVGWDECFPTVSVWDDGQRRLRDHGDLWGRPWRIDEQGASALSTSFTHDGYRFTRRLGLDGATLTADYRVESTGSLPLRFMWALHALLTTLPGERIRLPGVDRVRAAFIGLGGKRLPGGDVDWPGTAGELPFPLDEVQPISSLFAAKLYASDVHAASVGGVDGWLDLAWDGIDHLGIWMAYGAWPQPGSIHHLALEPTTAPADHLGQAIEQGTAIIVPAGGTSRWTVTFTLRAD